MCWRVFSAVKGTLATRDVSSEAVCRAAKAGFFSAREHVVALPSRAALDSLASLKVMSRKASPGRDDASLSKHSWRLWSDRPVSRSSQLSRATEEFASLVWNCRFLARACL